MRRFPRVAAVVVAAALAGSCSHSVSGRGAASGGTAGSGAPGGTSTASPGTGSATPGPSSSAPATPAPGSCPATYAAPDPNRPRITLTFDVAADLTRVTGTEKVRFIPDMPVHELVFRLTPNGPTSFPAGTSLTVQRATADPAGRAFRYERAGAASGSVGGVLVVPLGREVPAGQPVTADLAFTLTVGGGDFERFGNDGDLAWFGSGQPLFAWERGVGWHREDLAKWIGESATSEAADMDITVTAGAANTVLTSGVQDAPQDAGGGRRRWHARAATARDVAVTVGRLTTVSAQVGGARLTAAAASRDWANQVLGEVRRAMTLLAARFGPFPFPTLNVTLMPGRGGGIEYPGAIMLFGSEQVVDTHETAHQWFYGMVGDSQSRDPWLDEAFATYAEQLVDQGADAGSVQEPGDVGAGINDFPNMNAYFATVYGKGSAALAEARRAGGGAKFDAALRCYVNANAWRIARPADLAAALHDLPGALAVLRQARALR